MHMQATSMKTTADAAKSRAVRPLGQCAQILRIHQLIVALHSLDDRTLSQIGIERDEIERFAHAEVAHNL
jgi:uncharacterized protein YjiS (DUF1127 family)